jgi:hypothetical protein
LSAVKTGAMFATQDNNLVINGVDSCSPFADAINYIVVSNSSLLVFNGGQAKALCLPLEAPPLNYHQPYQFIVLPHLISLNFIDLYCQSVNALLTYTSDWLKCIL